MPGEREREPKVPVGQALECEALVHDAEGDALAGGKPRGDAAGHERSHHGAPVRQVPRPVTCLHVGDAVTRHR